MSELIRVQYQTVLQSSFWELFPRLYSIRLNPTCLFKKVFCAQWLWFIQACSPKQLWETWGGAKFILPLRP